MTASFIKGKAVREDLEQGLGVSQATANRMLRETLKTGKIRKVGKGRSTKYIY